MASDTIAAATGAVRARLRGEGTAFLGMVVFMASWAVLFASLFFAYGIVRAGTSVWPPLDLPRIPRLLPAVATVALALSSVALQRAYNIARSTLANAQTLAIHLAASLALGAAFLGLQSHVWQSVYAAGLRPETGTYASVFYGLTIFHALHVVVGLIALFYLSLRAAAGTYGPTRTTPLRLWALYWHMVGVIWGLMYVLVYLI